MNDQQRAAMQMALEAFELLKAFLPYPNPDTVQNPYHLAETTITALREALAQPQGEWVDLTDDEIKEAFESRTHIMQPWEPVKAIIAKFKEKNTPPVVPQGEPVAWIITEEGADSYVLTPHYSEVERALKCPQYKPKITPLYTTPPSVESAIEATKEKAANVAAGMLNDMHAYGFVVPAAIRSMK